MLNKKYLKAIGPVVVGLFLCERERSLFTMSEHNKYIYKLDNGRLPEGKSESSNFLNFIINDKVYEVKNAYNCVHNPQIF